MIDNDYYYYWAEEVFSSHFDALVLCNSESKVQIKVTHIIMDQGRVSEYQEAGHVLGSIIWPMVQDVQSSIQGGNI